MPFPLEQRFKNLQELVSNQSDENFHSHPWRPQLIPGVVIDFITRSDSGKCLKVVPFNVKAVTAGGDITFTDGTTNIPTGTINFYVKVYPIDVAPADVNSTFNIGDPIVFFEFWAPGSNAAKVKGTFVCMSPAAQNIGEFEYMNYTMVSQNSVGWGYETAHEVIE